MQNTENLLMLHLHKSIRVQVSFVWCAVSLTLFKDHLLVVAQLLEHGKRENIHICVTSGNAVFCRRDELTRTDFWCIPIKAKTVNLDECERLNKRRQCVRVVRAVYGLCVLCVARHVQSVLTYVQCDC
jgi:hypothetical protein